jgi:hypothetical protein
MAPWSEERSPGRWWPEPGPLAGLWLRSWRAPPPSRATGLTVAQAEVPTSPIAICANASSGDSIHFLALAARGLPRGILPICLAKSPKAPPAAAAGRLPPDLCTRTRGPGD